MTPHDNVHRAPPQSAIVAAALSAVLPGLGHIRTQPVRAAFLVGTSLATAGGFALWLLSRDREDLVGWTVRPDWLLAVVVASLVTLVARGLVVVDAARTAGLARSPHPWVSRIGLLVILVLVAAPHLAATTLAWQQRNLVTRVFAAERTVTARPTGVDPGAASAVIGALGLVTPSTPDGSDRDGVVPRIRSEALPMISSEQIDPDNPIDPVRSGGQPDDDPVPVPAQTSGVEPAPAVADGPTTWDGEERLSLVMLGSDGGYDRTGIRTDTIIVLSIDVATGEAVTFSVPRNWTNIPFPAGTAAAAAFPNGNPDLANTIYGVGENRPELFAQSDHSGGAAVKEAMAQTLGVPIHYFVMVDMSAVVKTIDLFGGIDMTVTEHINDRIRPIEEGGPYLDITVNPGQHHFDGLTTLAYVRSRVQSWDYSRMARQRCVVAALIDQVGPLEVLANFGPFSDIVADHVVTDIPLDRADELLAIAARLDPDRLQSVNFVPPEFPSGRVPLKKVRAAVESALTTDIAVDPSRSVTAACGAG